ncbi:5'/3'-nucleotidase SurE [Paraglaciecola aquimarina]|uniref:5'-nucleotidase SurE n=1 Tax=Paraglaciecola aquimarina TaxID=1235557 RepID=A0ABU3SV31_9ALTE|nr:5'/3'-nucleotidase SurE [Paraglaciecola aquimarina]MDU0353855.1 5'/3'-nucleotidase SurE [Paraglaciecola aquimarina]
MNILLSNDDGVFAKGLSALYYQLSQQHQVTVIAPDRNCSASSNALSIQTPLRVQQMDNGFYAVNGTPSDCVHLGINQLLTRPPELVVSGINHGANLGDDVIYSGTVAAATEGRHMGLPAIAVSLAGRNPTHFCSAAKCVTDIINLLVEHPLPADQILNVNVPDLAHDQIQGIQATRQGKRHQAENMTKAQDPTGKDIYWYGGVGPELDAGKGTDFHAIAHGYCSVTPLSIDMTAYDSLKALSQWIKNI